MFGVDAQRLMRHCVLPMLSGIGLGLVVVIVGQALPTGWSLAWYLVCLVLGCVVGTVYFVHLDRQIRRLLRNIDETEFKIRQQWKLLNDDDNA